MNIDTQFIIELFSVILTVFVGNKLTQWRIQQLEQKVEKHNSVVERTLVLEEKMKVSEHRIADLEAIHNEGH